MDQQMAHNNYVDDVIGNIQDYQNVSRKSANLVSR